MKLLVVGDLHGKSCWREIDASRYDRIIFIGDYVDGSEAVSDTDIFENLQGLIALKSSDPNRIVLLLGNHDIQYLHFPHFAGSGLRPSMQKQLTEFYRQHAHLFQVAWQRGNYLFTHAGVNKYWHHEFMHYPFVSSLKNEGDTLADLLNKVEQKLPEQRGILHRIGAPRGGEGFGGITWADKVELETAMLPGYHQVVGHTKVPSVKVIEVGPGTSVAFIDVLNTLTYFYEIDIPDPLFKPGL
jgi:hypothetical protein